MFVSQLIYTNCSGWSVWSKSADITGSEEDEIQRTMQYKPLENLPYKPTEEELNTLFPKKFSYFYLSSGRVCLAQSTYVGRVYKDGDFRMGNYIIHAFVFQESEDVVPMDYIENDLFKKRLTREEWHDQAAPDELQKIEIENHINISAQEINSFFDENRSEEFKLLLQSIIDALDTDQKITFYDKHDNLKYWYKAISLCLPKSIQKGLTFNTFANIGGKEAKIRNIIPDSNNAFDYRTGKYAFNFESKDFSSNIKVKNYVQTIVTGLKKDVTKVADFANKIGAISEQCSIDLDSALDVDFLLNNKIDKISKLNETIQIVEQFYQKELLDIANYIYAYSKNKWTLSKENVEIYRFMFQYSDEIAIEDIINQYISNQEVFGVKKDFEGSKEQVLNNYCVSFKSNAPFAWEKIIDYIFDKDNLKRYIEKYGTSFDNKFLIVYIFVNLKTQYEGQKGYEDTVEDYFADMIKTSVKSRKLEDALCLMHCIGKYDKRYPHQLIKEAYSSLPDVWDPEFTLELAEKYDNWDSAVKLISSLVSEKKEDKAFIKLYAERSSHKDKRKFYSFIFEKLNGDEAYVDFVDNVKKYNFEILKEVKWEQLQEYYAQYFVTGKDNGCLFREKLKQYLSAQHGKKRIEEIIKSYDAWVRGKASNQQVIDAYMEVIEDDSSADSLKEYILQSEKEKIDKLYSVLDGKNHRVLGYCKAIKYGKDIKQFVVQMKSSKQFLVVKDVLSSFELYCNNLQQFDSSCGESFVKMYLADVFELYFILQGKDRNNFEQIYGGLFEPLCVYGGFEQLFYDEMKRLDKKQQELFLWDTIVYVCCSSNKLNDGFKQEVKEFMKQYQKESRNILDKMFGGLKNKK